MDVDISRALSYEVKKEIAERYFGFRKLIEEDKEELARKIHRQSMTSEQKICLDLVRIYIILQEQELIDRFLELSGLGDDLFFDEYLLHSPTIRARVFAGIRIRGLTRSGRVKNLLLGVYERLVGHVAAYREKYGEMLESREFIDAEIRLFYRKNDLGSIMGFLRNLDGEDSSFVLNGPIHSGIDQELEDKLRVSPPAPLEHLLPVIPPLVPLARIKGPMKKLAAAALERSARFPEGSIRGATLLEEFF